MKKSKNLFSEEDLRNKLALENNLELLKKTYLKTNDAIKNINSGNFWNQKFSNKPHFKDQDLMTKEKINQTISFLPKNNCKILDVGIGMGYLEDRLKKLNLRHELYGIDISSISIENAKLNFKGNFIIGNTLDIDKYYKNNFFDAIVALELLEHIPSTQILILLNKINKILKKNGIFMISIPLNEGLRNMEENPNGHLREYTIPIIEAELKISGFKVIDKKTFYAFKNLYFFKKIISKIFKNRWQPNNVVIKAKKM